MAQRFLVIISYEIFAYRLEILLSDFIPDHMVYNISIGENHFLSQVFFLSSLTHLKFKTHV